MVGRPEKDDAAGSGERVHLTWKVRLPGMNGEGTVETEGGDQTRMLKAIVLMLAFGIGILPAVLLAAVCYLCAIPVWATVALPLTVWIVATATAIAILMRKESTAIRRGR